MSVEIVKEFRFDAAHFLPAAPEGHPYRRIEIALSGTPDPVAGWIVDFATIEAAFARLRHRLDHNLLNEIAGLGVPTLENMAAWIYRELAPGLQGLARVTLHRDSGGESATYRPDR
jgi:6-pyruvoyltetrahydropterin/6-carboxytetrahydropterin synthase